MPPAAPPPKKTVPSLPPNQTLYITNLPSAKIQKEDLRHSLYILFSTYGPVLDVVALKTMKMRGQAHVVFRDIQAASQAMRELQGFNFFGRDMGSEPLILQQIQYAKSKSDTIAKLDGTFHKPAAAAGEVTATALQQSIFNAPPSAAFTNSAPGTAPGSAKAPGTDTLKPPPGIAKDVAMEDAKSPATSNAGEKRKRDVDDEAGDSDSDVAMEEESDDE